MFGGLEKKMKEHAVNQLIAELGEKGSTHVDGIGTFTYNGETIVFTPELDLVTRVENEMEIHARIRASKTAGMRK